MSLRELLTTAAGHATAAAIHSLNTHGPHHNDTKDALVGAAALTEAAERNGATAEDIRRAGDLHP